MNSQTFFQTTLRLSPLVSAVALALISTHAVAAGAGQPQYYELRVYSTKSEQQQKLVSDYWQNAAVPAYNRMGIQPVGRANAFKFRAIAVNRRDPNWH
ncbi:MAG: hypothetical protein ABSA83_03730 [Verrucomicrobiota bacterium]|jgi:hypothetical protein